MANQIEVLQRARKLVEAGWTQKHFAVNRYGEPVPVASLDANRFCTSGAIDRAALDLRAETESASDAEDAVATTIRSYYPMLNVTRYNDAPDRTREDVLAIFDATLHRIDAAF